MKIMSAIVLCGLVGGAMGHGDEEEGDIGLMLNGGTLTTVLAEHDAGDSADAFLNDGQRVFEAEFNNLGFADEPGLYTNSFGGFSAGMFIGYNNRGPLRVWDGTDFDQAASGPLNQIVGPFTKSTPVGDVIEEGFRFAYSGGEFDEHADLQLTDTSNPGVFLWEVEFFAADAASGGNILATSKKVFIVLNFGVDEVAFEEAAEYAESIIPAPSSIAVLALGGFAAARRRRG